MEEGILVSDSKELLLPTRAYRSWWMICLGAMLFALLFIDIALGSLPIPLPEVMNVLLGKAAENSLWKKIIVTIRFPKAITAILCGAALSVSGMQMQTLFRNPLAGPSVLGVTSGASLGVAILMLGSGNMAGSLAIRSLGFSESWLIILSSSIGSAAVLLLVIGLSMRIWDNIVILIIGMLLSNLIIALVSIWQYFSEPEQIQDYLIWTFGSLSGVSNDQLYILIMVIAAGIALSFISSKYLNLLLIGENYAASLGLNIVAAKAIIIFSTSLLAGVVTGFCGPIGFIGVAVPHLCRALLNTTDHRILIPACCLLGADLMLVCDVISQMPGYNTVLPINAVTAIIGSPVVIWVILERKNMKGTF